MKASWQEAMWETPYEVILRDLDYIRIENEVNQNNQAVEAQKNGR